MKPVTDPALLAQLNGAAPAARPAMPTPEDMARRARELGIDPALPMAIFGIESGANWKSRDSYKGARGGMQVMPGTYQMMMGTSEGQNDPWQNMEAGLRYIAHGQKVLGTTDPALLAAGYHAGYGRKDLQAGRIPQGIGDGLMKTSDYAASVARKVGRQPAAVPGVSVASAAPAGLKPVSDPALLAQLEGDGIAAPAGLKPVSDAKLLAQLEGKTPVAEAIEGHWTDNFRDPLAGVLKIGPTVVKSVADLARLATNDRVGVDTSNWAKDGMQAIDDVVGSERMRAQQQAMSHVLQSDDFSLKDIPGAIADNPRAALNAGIATIGSMFVPAGVAGAVGKGIGAAGAAVQAGNAGKVAQVLGKVAPAKAATGAAIGTGAAMNAAETFSDTEGGETADRYQGAALSGATSLALGKLFGGGVDGLVARRLAGELGKDAAGAVAKSALQSAGKEAVQEFGEEGANSIGKQIGKDEEINVNRALKDAGYGASIGFAVGAGGDVTSNAHALRNNQAPAPVIDPDAPPVDEPAAQAVPMSERLEARASKLEAEGKLDEAREVRVQAQAVKLVEADPEAARRLVEEAQANDPELAQAAPAPEAAPAQPAGLKPQEGPVLQNRDRSTPSSIAQMQSIAAEPDYGRLGYSRDFANGAPVVTGGQVDPQHLGSQDMAVASDGRRIPVQYAVVEADSVLASNAVDGTPRPDYATSTQAMRAIAGNGRIAGLQAAAQRGTAQQYKQELMQDALHGIDPQVIAGMRAPVLVRVMPADQVTNNIGDLSNTSGNLSLSAVEQASNDGQRVDLSALEFAEDGAVTAQAVRQFVQGMPAAERGQLLDTNGQPTKQAVDRLNAAVFSRAYGNDQLVRLYAQAQDPEARLILSALAKLAPKMARLEGAGALDIRPIVSQAAEIAVNARRNGTPLAQAAAQLDMAADPLVGTVLQLFAQNPRSNRHIVEQLGNAADMAYAEANKPDEDLLGATVRATPEQVLQPLEASNEGPSTQTMEQPAGAGPVQADDVGPAPAAPAPADRAAAQADRAPDQAERASPGASADAQQQTIAASPDAASVSASQDAQTQAEAGRGAMKSDAKAAPSRADVLERATQAAAKALRDGGSEAVASRAATDVLLEHISETPDIELAQDAARALQGANAQAVKAQPVDEAVLQDLGLLREFGGRWKYKFNINDTKDYFANSKEDAVERAIEAYNKAKPEERLTREQRGAKADEDLFKQLDRNYAHMSMDQLQVEYEKLGGDIADLQRAGRNEFTGTGGRRTSAAVANEGARGAGEARLRLGVYMKMRAELEGPRRSQSERASTGNTPDAVRAALAARFGKTIAAMEKRGFLKIEAAGPDGAQGMYDGRAVTLYADGIQAGDELGVFLHEAGEHASMQAMLGDQYADLVARAHELVRDGDADALAAQARIPEDTAAAARDSELVAYMVETVANKKPLSLSAKARRWLADMVAGVRAWFYATSMNKTLAKYGQGIELTPQDVAALAERAVRWGEQQAGARRQEADGAQFSKAARSTTGGNQNPNGVQSAAAPWYVPEPDVKDRAERYFVDKQVDLRKLRDTLQATYGQLSDKVDGYLNDELYVSRAAARVKAMHAETIEPALAKIAVAGKNFGVTFDDVATYLHARHAPERNRMMKERNPDMANNEALSGMSDQEAATHMARLKQEGKLDALRKIAADWDAVIADTRAVLVAEGLEDADVVAAWEGAYKHYVPLQRDVEGQGSGTPRGMGYSVRGAESKAAVGSNREVVNIVANIVAQAETAIIRAEKARVGRALLAMAKQYPNPDFWTVDIPPVKPRFNKDTGLVERDAIDPMYQTADNVVMIKDERGKQHFIVFNKKNERAVEVGKALKNLGIEKIGPITQMVGRATRFLAMYLTARNPEFWLTNFARDIQGAMLQLEGHADTSGLQAQVAKNIPLAMNGVRDLLRGEGASEWAQWAREMEQEGGTTGYMQAYENSDARMKDLRKEVERMQQGKADPRRLARSALEFVDNYSEVVENGIRLAAYRAARDKGVSKKRAASIAKNITVNFNRKGNGTPFINSWYMFFNAALQGQRMMVNTLKRLPHSRVLQAAVGSMVVLGFMLDVYNRAEAGDDEETGLNRYDMIPSHEKTRNWIFMHDDGTYSKFPMVLGWGLFPNAGRLISEAIGSKRALKPHEYAWELAMMVVDSFSPIGTSPSPVQLAAPSVADPLVQLYENKNFMGTAVYKSGETPFGGHDPKPAYTRHFESTPDVWKKASELLNSLTGGDDVKRGAVDVEPDIIKHIVYTLTGGPGRAVDRTVDAMQANASGEDVSISRYPFAGRFAGEVDDKMRERAYWERKKEVEAARIDYEFQLKQGRRDLARATAKKLGDGDAAKGMRLMRDAKGTNKELMRINKRLKQLREQEAKGMDRSAQIKALRERKTDVMSRNVRRDAGDDD